MTDRMALLEYVELDDAMTDSPVIPPPVLPAEAITTHHAEAIGAAIVTGASGLTARASGNVLSARSLAGAADLDWKPEIVPLVAAGVEVDKSVGRAVVRSDSKRTIGIVGARYHAIDHSILFDLADAISGASGDSLTFANAGHKGDGARPFVQMRTAPENIGRGVSVGLNVTLFTSHDGTLALTAGFSSTVIVCKNTYAHAFADCKSGLRVKHTSGAALILQTALDVANAAGEFAGAWSNAALALMGKPFSDENMRALSKMLVPGDTKRAENTRGELLTAWTDAPGAMAGTAWGAAQAVSYYTSHSIGAAESRDETAIFGHGAGADLQEKAWWALEMPVDAMRAELAKVYVVRA